MTTQYFFYNQRDLPPGVGISAWGPEHIGWLVLIALACVLGCMRYRKLSDARRARWLKVIAVAIWVQETLKNLLHWRVGALAAEHLPLHLCGLSMFICAVVAFSRLALPRQMLYSLVLPGAVAALLFLDWTRYPVFNFSSITSFSIHGCLVLFALLPITAGQVRPDWRQLPKIFGLTLAVCVPLYPLNKVLGTNFFFLNTPSPGSPLMPLAELLGNPGYIVGVALLLVALWAIMYLPWALADRRAAARGRV